MKSMRWLSRRQLQYVTATAAILACNALGGCAAVPTSADVGSSTGLNLPVRPWEGGPGYWSQFPRAKAAGWDDPSFFPIGIWWDTVSSLDEAQFDKSLGINTYIENGPSLQASFLDAAGMYWVGEKLNDSFTTSTKNWVGYFLDDEVDGRFTPAEGRAHLESLRQKVPAGMFTYSNFTSMVVENNMDRADSQKYINQYTDAVSVDKYWYTIPQCSRKPYYNPSIIPIAQASCRTSSSYGATVDALRQIDAADGKLQPIWQFVEDLGGAGGAGDFSGYVTPAQLKGAVMNSLIHEARGIVYFNTSLAGPCQAGNVVRTVQKAADSCAKNQVGAMREINSLIRQLAPVLNTQTFIWNFGSNLDTMLKSRDGYAYIFAMPGAGSSPGSRELRLPPAVKGTDAEVVDEGRHISIGSEHMIRDVFASESSFHVYKVKI